MDFCMTDDREMLVEENRQLVRENKKLRRELARHEELMRRSKIAFDSRKQFNDIVKQERSKLELNMNLLLANIRDFILFFNTGGQLQYCSDSFLRAINITSSALIRGKLMREILGDILPPENIAQIIKLARDFAAGGMTRNLEMPLRADLNQSGIYHDYLVEVNILINEDGNSEGFVMLFYDTTDLSDARREAERANAVKSDFLATISHEIRTPMNAIIGLTGMVAESNLDVRQQDLLARIKTSSTSLLDIINDLLDFSKIEAGKLDIIEEYFDLIALLHDVQSIFTVMMAQKGLEFLCDFAENLPRVIYTDSKRVRQIMINLLNNAYKYTPQGAVTFAVFIAAEGSLGFSVTDTGIGIKAEERHKLFKEFEQLDQVRNKHVTGTGLGLAITKRLCDLMHGAIDVQSVYGEGSTFTVTLPYQSGSLENLPRSEAAPRQFTARAARILVVDDVAVNVEIVLYMLEQYAVQAESASNGQEAVEMIARQHFDLVLMDQMMPVMDGLEATHILRQRERELAERSGQPPVRLPVIALTANAISGVEDMFKREGFDGFISKPIDVNNLARTLYEFLPKNLIDG
jgi:signal transduction histidine kinase/CheY-like chemotaxis protein